MKRYFTPPVLLPNTPPKKPKLRLLVGDPVIVLAGNHKGATGDIESLNAIKQSVTVSGVNMRKKHTKPSHKHPSGGIINFAAPIALSNVNYYESETGKGTKIGYRLEDGKRVRFSRRTSKTLPTPERPTKTSR